MNKKLPIGGYKKVVLIVSMLMLAMMTTQSCSSKQKPLQEKYVFHYSYDDSYSIMEQTLKVSSLLTEGFRQKKIKGETIIFCDEKTSEIVKHKLDRLSLNGHFIEDGIKTLFIKIFERGITEEYFREFLIIIIEDPSISEVSYRLRVGIPLGSL